MDSRHDALGIKQVIRYEWLERTVNCLRSGMSAKVIRQELHEYLMERKGSGEEAERGLVSRNQVVNMLMTIWVSPDDSLCEFRNAALSLIRQDRAFDLAVHWAMVSAVYPFWFNVAFQSGRLLYLQEQITQPQIFARLKEKYGDRETVSRYARYTVRSFVAWRVLKDSEAKGCYEKTPPLVVANSELAVLILESSLHAVPEGKGSMGLLLNNPAFFPFNLPVMSGDYVSQRSDRIEVVRYGLDDELLRLKAAKCK